jgi:heme-degrading monooxygenase HmoA
MAILQVFPPNADNETLLGEIPGLRQTPIPAIGFDGPEGHLGPEATGAFLVLHMTMVEEERTQLFWRQVALTCKAASESPGFIRMIACFDGCASWAFGFWRTLEDAQAFARSRPHLEAVEDMRRHRFEYTHYAGLWQPATVRPREVYCDRCGRESHMPIDRCPGCGNELLDVFAQRRAPLERARSEGRS